MARILSMELTADARGSEMIYSPWSHGPTPRGRTRGVIEHTLRLEMAVTAAEAEKIVAFLRRQERGEAEPGAEELPARKASPVLDGEFVDPPKLPRGRRE